MGMVKKATYHVLSHIVVGHSIDRALSMSPLGECTCTRSCFTDVHGSCHGLTQLVGSGSQVLGVLVLVVHPCGRESINKLLLLSCLLLGHDLVLWSSPVEIVGDLWSSP